MLTSALEKSHELATMGRSPIGLGGQFPHLSDRIAEKGAQGSLPGLRDRVLRLESQRQARSVAGGLGGKFTTAQSWDKARP